MKNKTKDIAGLAIGILAVTLIVYFGFIENGGPAPVPAGDSGYAISARTLDEAGRGYSITGLYPVLKGAGAVAFNAYVSSVIQGRIDAFTRSLAAMDTSRLPPQMQNATSTLVIDYETVATSSDFVDFLFSSESYLIGMAHPTHALDSVNFDLAAGKEISLPDLFQPGADYLAAIADYSRNDILNQIKNGVYSSTEDYVNQNGGLIPDPVNFSVFNVTKNALIIRFQEYQVGPYVSGPASTSIPWSSLSGILNPFVSRYF